MTLGEHEITQKNSFDVLKKKKVCLQSATLIDYSNQCLQELSLIGASNFSLVASICN